MSFIPRDRLFDREQVMVDELAERIFKTPRSRAEDPKVTWWEAYSQAYEQLKDKLTARNRFFSGKQERGE